MRPVQIMDSPPMAPHCCSVCGSGSKNRDHFIDLGIDSTMFHDDNNGQKHITDGVIYLCNQCILSVFKSYFEKVYTHLGNKVELIKAMGINNSSTVDIQQAEIKHLQGVIEDLKKDNQELVRLGLEKAPTPVGSDAPAEKTATDALNTLVPGLIENEETESNLEENEDGTDGDNSDAAGDDSAPAGTVENSDGNDPANESLTSSGLFDLSQGFLVKRDA